MSDAKRIAKDAPELAKQVESGEKTISQAKRELKREKAKQSLSDIESQKAKAIEGVYDVVVIDPPWPMQKIEAVRSSAMRRGLAVLARCDQLWMVGGRISRGMKLESEEAAKLGIPVVDMTALGPEPPDEADTNPIIPAPAGGGFL